MDVGSTAWGINDLGDIVGMSWDATFNPLAARWTTRDPGPVRRIGLPGDWSMAVKVNNNRIAAGMYGVGHNQSNPGRGVAVQLR
jgi:probable HAF family extracellular repeat protein